MPSQEIPVKEFAPAEVKEERPVDNFNVLPERPQQQAQESEKVQESGHAVESNGPTHNTTNSAVQDHCSASADEAYGEQQKHTYASIVCVLFYMLIIV